MASLRLAADPESNKLLLFMKKHRQDFSTLRMLYSVLVVLAQ